VGCEAVADDTVIAAYLPSYVLILLDPKNPIFDPEDGGVYFPKSSVIGKVVPVLN
jgi:hypothetical protein